MKGFLDGRTVRKIGDMYIAPHKGTENACFVTKPAPAPATDEQRFAVILGELADALTDKKRQIAELLAKVDDLAQQLAVTESQLEDARKRLERYEGGGE